MSPEFPGITALARPNIRTMKPYSSARNEFKGTAQLMLDANENPFGSPDTGFNIAFNRYPDPLQWELKNQLSRIKGVPANHIFLGNGSDEIIDLMIRIFCEPGKDNILICTPTYGMYQVAAAISNVEVREVPLNASFQLDLDAIAIQTDSNSKLLILCSPNNPTGNSFYREDIEVVLNNFSGMVMMDEAYINYSRQHSFIRELTEYPNLVVMQTLSKAWGLAGLRIGMAFGALDLIELLNKVKPPYNISTVDQSLALRALQNPQTVNDWIQQVIRERNRMQTALEQFPWVEKVFPSDANFLLFRVSDAYHLYDYLIQQGIVVRNRSTDPGCSNCLRITIGSESENTRFLDVATSYQP